MTVTDCHALVTVISVSREIGDGGGVSIPCHGIRDMGWMSAEFIRDTGWVQLRFGR